jgi:hypothetical protein
MRPSDFLPFATTETGFLGGLLHMPVVDMVTMCFLPISVLVGIYIFIGNLIYAKNKLHMLSEWVPLGFFWWLRILSD